MLYLGLDVHSKWMTVRGLDVETGEEVEVKKLSNSPECMEEYFSNLAGPVFGAMECGTNSWSIYRVIEPYFEKLIVVDPATVWGRDIRRGAKTDRRDAMKLAMKMYRGELEPLYIPDEQTQDQRMLARAKINSTRRITKLVNEIGSVLRAWGVILDCSLLSKQGRQLVESSKPKLAKHSLATLELLLRELETAQQTEEELEETVKAEVAEDETCRRLLSIPDVGPLTALVVKSEIGTISRFSDSTKLVSYCGLSPKVIQSSETLYYGRLNRQCNKYLKYVLILRAQGISRSTQENPMRATYWRVVLRGKNHAKIAVARQLTRVIWRMLKDKQFWDPTKIDERRLRSKAA
jgi:transposase